MICLVFFTVAAVVAGIPKGIAEFEAPTDDQLITIAGKPISEGIEKRTERGGINTVLAFKVDGRDFLLEAGNWDGESGLETIHNAIETCDELSLKITEDDSYRYTPFWEMKADGEVIISKEEMVGRHNFERYLALLIPIGIVLFAIFAASVGVYHFFIKK